MGKEYPLAASCCLKSECIFKDLTTTPSYCLKRILFVLLHIQYVHTLQLSPQGPAGDQSRAPKRCRCREASPCHAEASSAQHHCSLTSASQIRLILAQQPHISQPQLQINSNSKLEYLKSSGKGLLLQHRRTSASSAGDMHDFQNVAGDWRGCVWDEVASVVIQLQVQRSCLGGAYHQPVS